MTRKVDWNALNEEVRQLALKKISPEERLKEAHRLADIYRKAGKPLPIYLAALV